MPLLTFRCTKCSTLKRTFQADPVHCDVLMARVLQAPQSKMMEARGERERGKSVLKDQDRILMERSKEDSRKNDYANFAMESGPEVAKVHGWVGSDGRVTKKIDQK